MSIRVPGRRGIARAAVVLPAVLAAAMVLAAETQAVPDLLEAPASADVRAQQSPQLGVAAAGSRFVGVGVRGLVLLSDDAGRTWRQAGAVPVSVALTDVHFVTSTDGWAVGHGGVVLQTTDGGETWQRRLDGREVARIIFEDARARADADTGDAAARALRDAQRLVEEGPDKPFLGVHFLDGQRGFAVGAYGLALATGDGGRSWHSLTGRIPNPRGKHLYTVRASGADVLIAGEQGALFRSLDGGQRFSAIETPYPGTWFGALALDRDTLLAYGLRGNVWRSADGGASWRQIELGQAVTLTSGSVLADRSIVLADESGRLLRSVDGARSFTPVAGSFPAGLTGIAQGGDGTLVLSGARGLSRVEPARLAVESR
ncbi:WD40/YVTN/BNR-like repeat-containing protein [Thauera sp.]|uniref:WD40/YVTN/BNR-like repeat-containing protein n=1 Tax=Thauera sp. TaxID=1905334 RepID=UPI0039E4154D